MGETTILRQRVPRSETQFRKIMAQAHRLRGQSGDEAWAKAHEQAIDDIRRGAIDGNSLSICPACVKRGVRTMTLDMGDHHKCGTCGWEESTAP